MTKRTTKRTTEFNQKTKRTTEFNHDEISKKYVVFEKTKVKVSHFPYQNHSYPSKVR